MTKLNNLFAIIALSIIVEAIITYGYEIVTNKKMILKQVLAIVLGVFIAISYNLDLLKLIGLDSNIPYVGVILTGIIISRGSNYLYDIFNKINSAKNNPAELLTDKGEE